MQNAKGALIIKNQLSLVLDSQDRQIQGLVEVNCKTELCLGLNIHSWGWNTSPSTSTQEIL